MRLPLLRGIGRERNAHFLPAMQHEDAYLPVVRKTRRERPEDLSRLRRPGKTTGESFEIG